MKTKIVLLLLIFTFTATFRSNAQYMAGETVPESQAVLDSWFVTNAAPGQLAYFSLIDTMFYYIQTTYTNVVAAQAAAATVSNAEFCVTAIFDFTNLNNSVGTMTVLHNNGYATNYYFWNICSFTVTNIFLLPMPDMSYTNGIRLVWQKAFTRNTHNFTNPVPVWGSCNQTQFVFTVAGDCPSTSGGEFYLQIF